MKALSFRDDSLGAEWDVIDIPPRSSPKKPKERRERLIEAVADVDDTS